jgi:SAM-dependent methyltransferase
VHAGHLGAIEWRIRRESWRTLRQLLRSHESGFRPNSRGSLRVLDVGAGNGWLSNRLCGEGHAPVALDLNVDAIDGLGACRAYHVAFPVVQADFDALPLAPGQFDVVVINASLHYAPDPAHTLEEASRAAVAGSPLVVMDSPIVADDEEGEAMVARQLADMQERFGIAPIRTGLGYLTLTRLQDAAACLGRRARFMVSRGPVRWRIGRLWDRWRLGRRPAVFGVWVAR